MFLCLCTCVCVCVCVCVCDSHVSVIFGIIHIYNNYCLLRLLWCTVSGHSSLRGLRAVPPQMQAWRNTQSHSCNTHISVALPGLYSAVPLKPASCPVPHFLQGPPADPVPSPPPLFLLLPLHVLLLLSSGIQGAAERILVWPRSQGCPGWWRSSEPSHASSSDGSCTWTKLRPCGFSHAQSSIPLAGRPAPAAHLVRSSMPFLALLLQLLLFQFLGGPLLLLLSSQNLHLLHDVFHR